MSTTEPDKDEVTVRGGNIRRVGPHAYETTDKSAMVVENRLCTMTLNLRSRMYRNGVTIWFRTPATIESL